MRRFDMYVPDDLTDLLEYLDSHQSAVQLITNGSDLINRIRKREVTPKVIVDLSGLSEFNYVRKDGETIRIGALTTIADLASSPVIDPRHAVFREVAAKFGGPAIRNVATIGGNICAASSSEDLLPVLLVLDAKVRLKSKLGERILPLEEFMKGKRLIDLKANEILIETNFQELDEHSACSFEKVGMRNSLIIAFVSSAVFLKLDRRRERFDDIRVAFNRVAGKIPERARRSEEALRGKILTPELLEDTVSVMKRELRTSSDFRASAEYRSDVACVLFKRALSRCYERLAGRNLV
jgi:xanthine dehydrogenase FAD-binding subunit